jgi:hypothetical protein
MAVKRAKRAAGRSNDRTVSEELGPRQKSI